MAWTPVRTIVMGQIRRRRVGLASCLCARRCNSHVELRGDAPAPKAVVAIYPAADLLLAWSSTRGLGPLTGRHLAIDYVGGSPTDHPDRYRTASPTSHVGAGSPPTLVAFGEHHGCQRLGNDNSPIACRALAWRAWFVAIPTWTTPSIWRGAAWARRSPGTRSRPSCDESCRRSRMAVAKTAASRRSATEVCAAEWTQKSHLAVSFMNRGGMSAVGRSQAPPFIPE